jgi:hypothetical protein
MELMQPIEFTPEMIINIIAVIASLLASYFPALSTWYAGLRSEVKSGIMIGAMLVVTVTIFLLVNNGLIPSTAGPITLVQAVYAFIQALIFNAGTYIVSPQTSKIKQIKASRGCII